MGIPNTATFLLYFPRRPLTAEWVTDILHALWDHGVQMTNDSYSEVTQWDDVLTAPRDGSVGPQTSSPSLQEIIHSEVEQGYASFGLGDFNAILEVTFDPNLVGEGGDVAQRQFGMILVSISKDFGRDEEPPSGQTTTPFFQIPMYEQIYSTYTHWFSQLCDIVQPTYGVGYYRKRNSDVLVGDVEDIYPYIDTELQAGRIPDTSRFLREEKVLYAAPQLVTQQQLEIWRHRPNMWVQQLPDGAVSLRQRADTYEQRTIEHYYFAAESSLEERDLPRAMRCYERARQLTVANRANTALFEYWQWQLTLLAPSLRQLLPGATILDA